LKGFELPFSLIPIASANILIHSKVRINLLSWDSTGEKIKYLLSQIFYSEKMSIEKIINEATSKELGKQLGKAITDGNVKATKRVINEIMKLPDIDLKHINAFSSEVVGIICGQLEVYKVPINNIEKKLNKNEKKVKSWLIKSVNRLASIDKKQEIEEEQKNKLLKASSKILAILEEAIIEKSKQFSEEDKKEVEKIVSHIKEIEEEIKNIIKNKKFSDIRE